ncbi:MAG: NUDIX hydrolase [Acidimicrobiales bacterium]
MGRSVDQTRRSAVLVPLYTFEGELYVVLTRRSAELRSHRWEVSFPGGGHDDGDASLWHTAVRESQEEIGLDPDQPTRIGELDRFVTVGSRSLIHPFVADLGDRPHLVPSLDEVETIRHVRVAELLLDEVYREEQWLFPGGQVHRPLTFFELYGDTVWGATAAMLRQLLSIGLGLDDGLAYDRDPLGRDDPDPTHDS